MKATTSLIFIYTLLLFLLHNSAATETPAAALAPSPTASATGDGQNDTDFILSSCKNTIYPEVCYNSLSPYARSVQQDHEKLAKVAISVSMSQAASTAAYFKNLSSQAQAQAQAEADETDTRATAALHDCFLVFRDSVYQMRQSLVQMRRLGGSAEALRFQMSNVQTWMSAAETDEYTCQDGFEGVADGPLKTDVCDRALNAIHVTSNALALVNYFTNSL